MGEYAEYTTDHNNIKGEFYRVNIQVNEYLIENYTGARILGIITHEAGHALGLAHVNPSVNPNSVMVSASSSRTNVSPTNFDKGIVSEIYSGHSH